MEAGATEREEDRPLRPTERNRKRQITKSVDNKPHQGRRNPDDQPLHPTQRARLRQEMSAPVDGQAVPVVYPVRVDVYGNVAWTGWHPVSKRHEEGGERGGGGGARPHAREAHCAGDARRPVTKVPSQGAWPAPE